MSISNMSVGPLRLIVPPQLNSPAFYYNRSDIFFPGAELKQEVERILGAIEKKAAETETENSVFEQTVRLVNKKIQHAKQSRKDQRAAEVSTTPHSCCVKDIINNNTVIS